MKDKDYKYLLIPPNPLKNEIKSPPFFGVHARLPILLALLLGLQHALAMLAGLTAPTLILTGSGGVNLPVEVQQYCVSAVLIFCAFGTAV